MSTQESETPRRGRPPKAAEERQGKVVAVRFSETGYGVLEALLEHQRAQMVAIGVDPADYSPAHVLRDLVTRRARELGLVPATQLAPPSAPSSAREAPEPPAESTAPRKPRAAKGAEEAELTDDELRAGVRRVLEGGVSQAAFWAEVGFDKGSGSRWFGGKTLPHGRPQTLTKRAELVAVLRRYKSL